MSSIRRAEEADLQSMFRSGRAIGSVVHRIDPEARTLSAVGFSIFG